MAFATSRNTCLQLSVAFLTMLLIGLPNSSTAMFELAIPMQYCFDISCYNSRNYSINTYRSNETRRNFGSSGRVSFRSSVSNRDVFSDYIVVDKNEHPEASKRMYVLWVNGELEDISNLEKIHDIQDLKQGKHLLYLVNIIFSYPRNSRPIVYEDPKSNFDRIITILRKNNVKTKFNEADLINGKSEALILLLGSLRHQVIFKAASSILNNMPVTSPVRPESALLTWCQKSISVFPYDINVENYGSDWEDGLAFSALLSKWTRKFDYKKAKEMKVIERLDYAFDHALKVLKIHKLFSPDDIKQRVVEEMFVLLYVAKINLRAKLTLEQLGEIGLCDAGLLEFRKVFTGNITEYSKWYLEMEIQFLQTSKVTTVRHIVRIKVEFIKWISLIEGRRKLIHTERKKFNKYCSDSNVINPEIEHLLNSWTNSFNAFITRFSVRLSTFGDRCRGIYLTTFKRVEDIIHELHAELRFLRKSGSKDTYKISEQLQRINATIVNIHFDALRSVVQFFIKDYKKYIAYPVMQDIIDAFKKLEQDYFDLIAYFKDVLNWWKDLEKNKGDQKGKDDAKGLDFIKSLQFLLAADPNPSDEDLLKKIINDLQVMVDTKHPEYSEEITKQVDEVKEKAKKRITHLQKMLAKLQKLLHDMHDLEHNNGINDLYDNIDDRDLKESIPKIEKRFKNVKSQFEALQGVCRSRGYEIIDPIQRRWDELVRKWNHILQYSKSVNHIYIKWITWSLNTLGVDMGPPSKIEDLKNGKSMCFLLRVLVDAGCYDDPVCQHSSRIPPKEFFDAVAKYLVRFDVVPSYQDLHIKNMIKGKKEDLLNLLAIYRDFHIKAQLKVLTDHLVMTSDVERPEDALLLWCKKSAQRNFIIHDFTSKSWSSGLALGAILAQWKKPFKFNVLAKKAPKNRFNAIFYFIKSALNVPPILTYEDFNNDAMDERFLILYLTYVFRSLPHSSKDLAKIGLNADKRFSEFKDRLENQKETYKNWYYEVNEMVGLLLAIKAEKDIYKNYRQFQTWMAEMKKYQKNLENLRKQYQTYYEKLQGFTNPAIDALWNEWNMGFVEFQKQFLTYYNTFKKNAYKFIKETCLRSRPELDNIKQTLDRLEETMNIPNNKEITNVMLKEMKEELTKISKKNKLIQADLKVTDVIVRNFVRRFSAATGRPFDRKDLETLKLDNRDVEEEASVLRERFYELEGKFTKFGKLIEEQKGVIQYIKILESMIKKVGDLEHKPPNPSKRDSIEKRIRLYKDYLYKADTFVKRTTYKWSHETIKDLVEKLEKLINPALEKMEDAFEKIAEFEGELLDLRDRRIDSLVKMVKHDYDVTQEIRDIEARIAKIRQEMGDIRRECRKHGYEFDYKLKSAFDDIESKYQWILDNGKYKSSRRMAMASAISGRRFQFSEMPDIFNDISQLSDGKQILTIVSEVFYINKPIEISDNPADNFKAIVKILKKNKVTVDIDVKDLASGKVSSILQLALIVQNYAIASQVKFPVKLYNSEVNKYTNPIELLLILVRKSVSNADIQVDNFQYSTWSDGLAFSALLARWYSDFDYGHVITLTIEQRLEYVFNFVENILNFTPLFTIEELVNSDGNETAIITYITQIFSGVINKHPHMWTELGFGSTDRKLKTLRDRILNETRLFDEWYQATMRHIPDIYALNGMDDIFKAGRQFDELLEDIENHRTEIKEMEKRYKNYCAKHDHSVDKDTIELVDNWQHNFDNFYIDFSNQFNAFVKNSFSFIEAAAAMDNAEISEIKKELKSININFNNITQVSHRLHGLRIRTLNTPLTTLIRQFKYFWESYGERHKIKNVKILSKRLSKTLKLFFETNDQINLKVTEIEHVKSLIKALQNFIESTETLFDEPINKSDVKALLKRIKDLKRKKELAVQYFKMDASEYATKVHKVFRSIRQKIEDYKGRYYKKARSR